MPRRAQRRSRRILRRILSALHYYSFLLFWISAVTHTARVDAPLRLWYRMPLDFWLRFYFIWRDVRPDYVSRIHLPLGRFLFRRVSLFVTRSILRISLVLMKTWVCCVTVCALHGHGSNADTRRDSFATRKWPNNTTQSTTSSKNSFLI